jgi:hypothetical protein
MAKSAGFGLPGGGAGDQSAVLGSGNTGGDEQIPRAGRNNKLSGECLGFKV